MGVHAHDRDGVERARQAHGAAQRRRRRDRAGVLRRLGRPLLRRDDRGAGRAVRQLRDRRRLRLREARAARGRCTASSPPRPEATPSSARRCSARRLALSDDATTLLVTGQSDNNLAGAAWSYVATTPPAVSGVAPAVGTTRGGTAVVIRGTGFASAGIDAVSSVRFAGVPAASFHVASPTQIDAIAPPHGGGGGRRDRDRTRRDHTDHRHRPVSLRRRPGRSDEGRRERRQPPGHDHLQAPGRDRPRHLPRHCLTGRRARLRAAQPDHRARPAQRPALPVPRGRHQRRGHESLLAAVARGHAIRAAAALARVDPGDGPARSTHRLHRVRGPALTQARIARGGAAARAALRRAWSRRACARLRPPTTRDGPGHARSAHDRPLPRRAGG